MKMFWVLCYFATFTLISGASALADIQEGVVIYFSFDKIDGNTVINEADHKINGTLEGKAKQSAGYRKSGVALNTDVDEATPGEDFVRVADCPELNVDRQFTIAMWAKADNFGDYRTLISKTDSGAYALTVEEKLPTAWVHIQGDYLHVIGTTVLQSDRWYHLALTFDSGKATIYLDGEEEAKGVREGNVTVCSADFMIGAEPSGKVVDPTYPAWHGVIDEFYFYNRALTKEEIGMLIRQASAVKPANKLSVCWGAIKG